MENIKNKLKDADVITNGFDIYRSNMEETPNKVDA